MNLATGTVISQLPTGTIDGLSAVVPMTIGMATGTATTIRSQLQAVTEFAYLGYSISPSISNSSLVLAIKGYNGNDPSVSNPCRFAIGNSFYYLTAATSFTAPSGTNWLNASATGTAGNSVDYFVYGIEETGASAGLKFGFARIPYAKTMNDFTNTTTSDRYIKGNWTNFNSTDKVINIGRFRAALSSTKLWSIPSSSVVNRPIYETDFMTWTPNITAQGGVPTTVSSSCKYQVSGNNIFVVGSVTVTNKGTATGAIILGVPITPLANAGLYGQESGATGASTNGTYFLSPDQIWLFKYDATTLWVNLYTAGFAGFVPLA